MLLTFYYNTHSVTFNHGVQNARFWSISDFRFQIWGLEMPIGKHKYWKVWQNLNSEILCSWAVQRKDIPSALKHTFSVKPSLCTQLAHCAHTHESHAAPSPSSVSSLSLLNCYPKHQAPSCPHGGNSKISLIRVCSGVSAEPTDDAKFNGFTGNQNSPQMPGRILSFSILLAYQL